MGTAGSGCGRESDRPGGDNEEIREGAGLVFYRGEFLTLSQQTARRFFTHAKAAKGAKGGEFLICDFGFLIICS